MKKKVLFIIGTLQSGGVSKSMVSLLNAWDKEKYDTSLLLCCKEGDVFSKYLPDGVRLIYSPVIENVMGGISSAKWLLTHDHFLLCLGVLFRLILSRISRSLAGELIAKMMPVVTYEHYDLIVDYGGQQLLYYMVNKLKGKKKVSFFHSDYAKWSYYNRTDKIYYPKVDGIFTISQQCVESLHKYFPDCMSKIHLMENISFPSVIDKLSTMDIDNSRFREAEKENKHIFVTIGHVWYKKGIDFAIEASGILKKRGIRFLWVFIGNVQEDKWINKISKQGLEHEFLFTGILPNPYPYLKAADIYIHPSRFEGKSIALDEAKILCKPIVVTNFSTVTDQFEDRVNASICEMNGNDLAEKITELVQNPSLRIAYEDYLREHVVDNSSEVEKLYAFL